MSGDDRRTFERFKLEFPLICSQAETKEKIRLYTHDISAEGLGVISDKQLFIGATLNAELYVPNGNKELPVQARVLWCRMFGKNFRVGLVMEQVGLMEISAVLQSLHARPN